MISQLPHVTVVVPCYNREATVIPAIESVLTQDYPSLDVIAVDDRSTDNTLAVLRSISDERLQVAENTGPKGASGARNTGASLAQSTWIAFQDSDDLWRPGKLKRQMERVATGDWVAVYCAMEVIDEQGQAPRRIGRVPDLGATHLEGDILPELTFRSLISTQTLVVRSDVFRAVGGFDTDFRSLDDWELMLRIAQEGRIAFVDEELVEQRMSENSITRSATKRLEAQKAILTKHRQLLERYDGALAYHHHRVAGAYRADGQFKNAALHARLARAASPMVARYNLMLAYTILRGLFQRTGS